jgi:high-affinity Fe2+/Pb2+ permease
MYSRVWFAYVLFLVYVGGLLVLFIYICLVRRNYPITFRMSGLIILFLLAGVLREDNGLKDIKTDQFIGSRI